MRGFITLLCLCLAVTLFQYLVIVALVAVVGMVIWGVCTRPQEMFGFAILCILGKLIGDHPLACLMVLGGLGVTVCVVSRQCDTEATPEP